MNSLAIQCRLCGNENLFPLKYAGRTLFCSHCGEKLPVVAEDGKTVTAVPSQPDPAKTNSTNESGRRRLLRAITHGLCVLCFLVVGVVGGGHIGVLLAYRWGELGEMLSWVSGPIAGLIGLWLFRWIGYGTGKLMSSYRLVLPGLLLGMGGGFFVWWQQADVEYLQLIEAHLAFSDWFSLSLHSAVGGLLVGVISMLGDALFNITR